MLSGQLESKEDNDDYNQRSLTMNTGSELREPEPGSETHEGKAETPTKGPEEVKAKPDELRAIKQDTTTTWEELDALFIKNWICPIITSGDILQA